ncbi:MAG: hypothetical protein U0165_02155 [Polyangiaceae bacterium]
MSRLYGSLDSQPLLATLSLGKPHEQAVSMFLLGESKNRRAVEGIAPHLLHGRPILRYYARGALEKILGEKAPLDVHANCTELAHDAETWLSKHGFRVSLDANTKPQYEKELDGPDAR